MLKARIEAAIEEGELTEEQNQLLCDHDCRRLIYLEPVVNISKKMNLGASHAKGELLLFLNDDIEVLNPNWIERMIEHFEKPHVGVVGSKILYPDRRIYHVGIVYNCGIPEHVMHLVLGDEEGYYFSTCGVRNYMAVTGGVMMSSSYIFQKVGGFSEKLADSSHDIDYCLKVREEGFQSVYAPMVELERMVYQSRVDSSDMREVAWYNKKWASHLVFDPYYNEQFLTVAPSTFTPCVNQRLI